MYRKSPVVTRAQKINNQKCVVGPIALGDVAKMRPSNLIYATTLSFHIFQENSISLGFRFIDLIGNAVVSHEIAIKRFTCMKIRSERGIRLEKYGPLLKKRTVGKMTQT